MKEQFTPPPSEGEPKRDDTGVTRDIGAVPELIPEPKRTKSWANTDIDPDQRIDLNAPDATERLDKVHDELGSGDEIGESEEVTPEDERELEEAFAEIDKQKEEDAEDPIGREILEMKKRQDDAEINRRLAELEPTSQEPEDEWDEPTKVDPPRPAA